MMTQAHVTKARSLCGGALLALCALALPGAARADGALLMDDFEDRDLQAAPGVSWVMIGDELAGGASTSRLELVPGAAGSRGALALSGELAPGQRGAYAGVWTAIGPEGVPRDLSAYTGLRFRARGTPGSYSAGLRPAGGAFNFVGPFEIGAEWRDIEVPFASLVPQGTQDEVAWNPDALGWVGFSIATTASTATGFRIEIDDVGFVPAPVPPFFRVGKLALDDAAPLASLPWRPLATDPAGDGTSPRLPDAAALAWAPDGDGRVWFRVALHGPAPERWLGINVALDVDGDPTNGTAWWGANKAFHFDRLVTAYLWPGAGYWQGALGVARAESVTRGVMDDLSRDVRVAVDRGAPGAFLVGVPGAALAGGRPTRLIATVGSAMLNNDDLPDSGAAEANLPTAPGGR